jgi:hypothetical protein
MEIPLAQAPWLKFHKAVTVRMLWYKSERKTLKEVKCTKEEWGRQNRVFSMTPRKLRKLNERVRKLT